MRGQGKRGKGTREEEENKSVLIIYDGGIFA